MYGGPSTGGNSNSGREYSFLVGQGVGTLTFAEPLTHDLDDQQQHPPTGRKSEDLGHEPLPERADALLTGYCDQATLFGLSSIVGGLCI